MHFWMSQQWFAMFQLIKSTWINIIFETAPLAGGWLSPGWGKYYPIWDTAYSYFEKGCQKKVHVTILKGNMGYDQHWSCWKYFWCIALALGNIRPWPLVPLFQISMKNSQLKTTHNTFQVSRVKFSDNLSHNSCIGIFHNEGYHGFQAT